MLCASAHVKVHGVEVYSACVKMCGVGGMMYWCDV